MHKQLSAKNGIVRSFIFENVSESFLQIKLELSFIIVL